MPFHGNRWHHLPGGRAGPTTRRSGGAPAALPAALELLAPTVPTPRPATPAVDPTAGTESAPTRPLPALPAPAPAPARNPAPATSDAAAASLVVASPTACVVSSSFSRSRSLSAKDHVCAVRLWLSSARRSSLSLIPLMRVDTRPSFHAATNLPKSLRIGGTQQRYIK